MRALKHTDNSKGRPWKRPELGRAGNLLCPLETAEAFTVAACAGREPGCAGDRAIDRPLWVLKPGTHGDNPTGVRARTLLSVPKYPETNTTSLVVTLPRKGGKLVSNNISTYPVDSYTGNILFFQQL